MSANISAKTRDDSLALLKGRSPREVSPQALFWGPGTPPPPQLPRVTCPPVSWSLESPSWWVSQLAELLTHSTALEGNGSGSLQGMGLPPWPLTCPISS